MNTLVGSNSSRDSKVMLSLHVIKISSQMTINFYWKLPTSLISTSLFVVYHSPFQFLQDMKY